MAAAEAETAAEPPGDEEGVPTDNRGRATAIATAIVPAIVPPPSIGFRSQ